MSVRGESVRGEGVGGGGANWRMQRGWWASFGTW